MSQKTNLLALLAGVGLGCFFYAFQGSATSHNVQPVVPLQTASSEAPLEIVDVTGKAWRRGLIMSGSTPHRLLLFSFDDGPNWQTTPRLLEYLDQQGIRAVFFLSMSRMLGEGYREAQQRSIALTIARRGHLVANHTLQHVQLPTLTNQQFIAELEQSEDVFSDVFGSRPWIIRPPGGSRSARIDNLLAKRGYTTMLWNINSGDVFARTPEAVFRTWQRVMQRREREYGERGGIVLMHDTHPWTIDALQMIIDEVKRLNCQLLDQNEELYDIVDDPSFFFVPRQDAPPSMLAPPARPASSILQARQEALRAKALQSCSRLAQR